MLPHYIVKWVSPLKSGECAAGRICQGIAAESCHPATAGFHVMTHSCSDGRQDDAFFHQAPGL